MNRNYTFVILCLAMLINLQARAESDYAWPLKLTPELTSKFCDYRAGHFHSGLDIRTGGRIGVPVYAVDDGYVWRVAMSFRGYGKALYLKLKDDRIVVYGHLSGLFDSLSDYVRDAQFRDKKYSQDLYFKPGDFPVKKGQLVAYSGSTGTGAPHLHLELRSPLNNPINPTTSGFPLPDKSAPRFDFLALRYYDAATNLDAIPGDPCEIEYIAINNRAGTNSYTIPDTIISDGNLALAISGGDHLAGPGFLYSFYGLKMSIDDKLVFDMTCDSLSYSTTRQLNYVRDLELIRAFADKKKTDNDANIFYRVYIPPNANQFFWSKMRSQNGIIPPGEPGVTRKVVITAYDEFNNSSYLTIYIRTPELKSADLKIISVARQKDSLLVECDSPDLIRKIIGEYRAKSDSPYKKITARFSAIGTGNDGLQRFRIKLPGGSGEYRFRFLDNKGMTNGWYYLTDDSRKDKLRIFGAPDLLIVEYHSKIVGPGVSLTITNAGHSYSTDMIPSGPKQYRAEIRGERLARATKFSISEDNIASFDTLLVLYPVSRGSAIEAKSPDSTLTIEFQTNSAYYPAYVFANSASREASKEGPAIIYDIQPDNFLADQNIKYKIDAVKSGLIGKKAGIYGYSYTSGGWNFISKILGNALEANGIGLGKIAVLIDEIPPVIADVTPSKSTKSRTPHLSCSPSDNLSGLALDDGISMRLDGAWVPAEYDIDSGKFWYSVKNPLKPGNHTIEIKAVDNQGNLTTKTVNFKVL